MSLSTQLVFLFVLAIPVACITWTVTHEEVFKEPREFCTQISRKSKYFLLRKIFYMLTCEYCFSHYVTIFILLITDYKLLLDNWAGYVIAGFSLVWIANFYMSLYAFIRIDIKKERILTKKEEEKLN